MKSSEMGPLVDGKFPIWLKFFLQVRVCEERKNLEAELPATSGSGVMRSRNFGNSSKIDRDMYI